MQRFKEKTLFKRIRDNFALNPKGDHGQGHWLRVYRNALKIASYCDIQSSVFEYFALLHDSMRLDEFEDHGHGQRALMYGRYLINEGLIRLDAEDQNRLLYACANHTKPDSSDRLYNDIVVQICWDADRLDIGRVGIIPDPKYFFTQYGQQLASELFRTMKKSNN